MVSDLDLQQAAVALRDEWPVLFADDAGAVVTIIDATPPDDPEALRRAATRLLELLAVHPLAREALARQLGIETDTLRGYEQLLGPSNVPVQTLMVCPIDPGHYQQYRRTKGQLLICPEHERDLVPKDSLPSA